MLRTARLSVSDEKWSRPRHPASLTPLWVQTASSGACASTAPAAIVQGPRGQVSSCSSVTWLHLLPFLLSSAFSTFPVPVTNSPLPVHPSLIHPNCGLSPLSSTLMPCFQCQLSEQPVGIPVWGLIYWGHNVLFLNGILGVANLFQAPKGVSGYTQSSWKAPRHRGCSLW